MTQNYKSIFLDAKNILHLERVSQVLGQYVQNEMFQGATGMNNIYPKLNVSSQELVEYLGKYGITDYEISIDEALKIIG